MAKNKIDVSWEDDDSEFGNNESANSEFASLFKEEADSADETVNLRTGSLVQGRVISVSSTSNDVIISLDGKNTGVADKSEFTGTDGALTIYPGDEVQLYISSIQNDEIVLSRSRSRSLAAGDTLRTAFLEKSAVKGRITKENKGGFDVEIMGKTGFCPVSQIDTKFVTDKSIYIGKDFDFIVQKCDPQGRNIVVSRSALLERQAEERLREILANSQEGAILDATITELREFGAFADIGGIEGLIHVSELSFSRVKNPSEVVTRGDKVRVKILKIDSQPSGKPKISLSMKQASQDPWDDVSLLVQQGQTYEGKVTRITDFGAFVEVAPGLEGLVHVSEMSWTRRISKPSEVVAEGAKVSVRVVSIDSANRRLSLSLKSIEEDPWLANKELLQPGTKIHGKIDRLKGFGAIVDLCPGITGMIPMATLKKAFGENYRKKAAPPATLEVMVQSCDPLEKRILLGLPGHESDEDSESDYRAFLASETPPIRQAEKLTSHVTTAEIGTFGSLLKSTLEKKK